MRIKTLSPSTSPPVARFGELLDRYAGYEPVDCPECGEIGLDVWISEGASVGRGVCVANGCEVEVLDESVEVEVPTDE